MLRSFWGWLGKKRNISRPWHCSHSISTLSFIVVFAPEEEEEEKDDDDEKFSLPLSLSSEKVDVAVRLAQNLNGFARLFASAQVQRPAARRSPLVDGSAGRLAIAHVEAGARGARRYIPVHHQAVERADEGRCAPSFVVDV